MWVSVTLAVLVELVPSKIKTTSVAVYFFIISNIGGNMPLLVPALKNLFENSYKVTSVEAIRCNSSIFIYIIQLFVDDQYLKCKCNCNNYFRHVALSLPWRVCDSLCPFPPHLVRPEERH
jgi:hypothetical protein